MEKEQVKALVIASLTALGTGMSYFHWSQLKKGANHESSISKSLALSGMVVGLGALLFNRQKPLPQITKETEWVERVTSEERRAEISY